MTMRFFALIYLFSLLASCAHFQSTPQSLNRDIDVWLANNEYDKIDNALLSVDITDNSYKKVLQRKDALLKRKNAYIEKTIQKANKLKQKKNWQKAITTYNNALDKVEDNPKLLKQKAALISERDLQVNELKKTLLLKQANALISYKTIYKQLHQLIPEDYAAKTDINQYEEDSIRIASYLEQCGEQASKSKQLSFARDCYSLSNQLAPSKTKQALVEKIERRLKDRANKKRYDELLSSYKNAYRKKEYSKARLHLNTLLAINPAHQQGIKHLETLENEISALVSDKINEGKELYSKKKINEALSLWKEAKQLNPNNDELNQLITRAKKVSKKIESLEHSQ